MKLLSAGRFLVLLLLADATQAAQPGSYDTAFVTVPGTDQTPLVIAHYPGGKVLAGGSFTNYGGTGRAGLVRLNSDGTVDTGFTLPVPIQIVPPVILNGQVLVTGRTNVGNIRAALALPDGRVVMAGDFTHLGGTAVKRLAVLAADGSPLPFAAQPDSFEPVALLKGPGDTFYASGKGTLADGVLSLVRLKTDGTRDAGFAASTFASLGVLSASFDTLMPGPGDTFYGVLNSAVALTTVRFDLTRFKADGSLDTTFNGTGRAQLSLPTAFQFAPAPGGQIVFYSNGQYRGASLPRRLNRLTLAGDLDTGFVPGLDPGTTALVAVQPDGKVLTTGTTAGLVARLGADGTRDLGYADPAKVPTARTLNLVRLLAAPDGSLFGVGSQFVFTPTFELSSGVFHILGDPSSAPTISTPPLAQTNTFGARTRFVVGAQGAAPLTYQWTRNGTPIPGATATDLVLEPTTAADRDAEFACVVANGLGTATTVPVRLTLLEATTGSVYRESDVPVGPNGDVNDLQLDASGRLLVAGGFTTWNGSPRVRIARLQPDGRVVDPAFDPGSQLNTVVTLNAVQPLSSGKSLVLGNLSVGYGTQSHRGYLRLLENGGVDPSFNPAGVGADALLTATARPVEDAEGRLVLYNSGWNDENLGSSFFRLKVDGTRDGTFALRGTSYLVISGAILRLPDGKFLVAANRLPLNPAGPPNPGNVLRLNADGTVDPTFVHDALLPFAVGGITQLLRQPDGRILVAGEFTSVDGEGVPLGVMRLGADGRLDTSFNPIPRLASLPRVGRMALQADGRILVLPLFAPVAHAVHRLWPNGLLDPEYQPATEAAAQGKASLSALAISADNTHFFGGSFLQFGGLPRTNFVRLNGGPLHAIPAAPVIVSQSTRVVGKAGGSVTLEAVPGVDGPFQFQWRRNRGVGSTNIMDIVGATNATLTLANLSLSPQDSGLYQVAVANPGGAVFSQYITLLVEPDPVVPGTVDTAFLAPAFRGILTSQPQISDPAPEGQLYASLGTTLARLFEDGTPDRSFNPPADLVPAALNGGGISAVKRQPDGKILIAGRMKDGALARLLPDGSYDPEFVRTNSYTGFFQNVPWELGLQSDGKILLAGSFENFAGRPVNGLIRFLPNGAVDESFPLTGIVNLLPNPTRNLPGTVISLRVLPDDRIYVGGGFNRVDGAVRNGIARLRADGSLDTTFVPPTDGSASGGTSGSMLFYQMGPVLPDGGVYVFGTFRRDPNGPADSALWLRPDGSIDGTLHVTTDFQINFGALQGDGKLIVTGQFTRLNGVARPGFARLNGDGTTDTTFVQGATYGVGEPMTVLPDGKLLVGNRRFFTGVGPAVVAPEVGFTLTGNGLELEWPAGYRLQRATQLAPANWQELPNPSPFTVPTSGPGEFYRLVPVP